ncbi:MAG: SUF system Fe-S cluster assembly protein [Proteobacteria bacterium]|nr:SUF system Fe-S cluster assembly protein [Pseudomonadota bacterium]
MSEREDYGVPDFQPSPPPEDVTAYAGTALAPDAPEASRDAVITALRTVHDPEIPVNIYELGLIYELRLAAAGRVAIDMTLTAPACPVAGAMPQQVADAVAAVPGVGEVEVNLVWEPPWTKDLMSEEAKVALDMW